MIHILLLILKIIGIILLSILALCLLILFFPVTYKMKANFEGKDFQITVKCGWLFHLLHFGGNFSGKESVAKIRIFGIPINLLKVKKETKQKKEKKHKENQKKKKETFAENKEELHQEEFFEKEKTDDNILQQDKEEKQTEKEAKEKNIEKKSFIEKIKDIFVNIYYFFKKVINTIKKAFKDVKGAYNKAKEVKAFFTANTTKEAYRYGKRIIIKAVRHIFPSKIKMKVHFGFEQPDVTGKVLGYIAMAFSAGHVNRKRVVIIPDFDKKIFEGNINIKGHFLIGVLFVYALRFYFKKEIHDIIKKFS